METQVARYTAQYGKKPVCVIGEFSGKRQLPQFNSKRDEDYYPRDYQAIKAAQDAGTEPGIPESENNPEGCLEEKVVQQFRDGAILGTVIITDKRHTVERRQPFAKKRRIHPEIVGIPENRK